MNTRYYLSNCNNPRLLLGLLFAFVAIFIFFPYASSYFFIFDDYAQLDFVSRHSYKDLLVLSEHGNYRPIAFIFWKTWFYLAGVQNPWFFSFMNLLFHSINALLLRWLLIRFRFKPYTAACASGFFLIFPPINEALFWMSGGHDVYGMTFFLIAILCASFALTPQLRKGAIVWIGIASFSFNVLAMLSKETAYLGLPFVLALFFLQSKKQKLNRTVLATWFFALNGAVIVFFVLRAQVISIHQSAYGNPIDFYSKADVFKNLLNNTWALFSYGYFGDSKVIALVCRVGGILSISTIAGFFWCKRKFGESLLLLTLILALGVTVFVDVGPGAAASGRLLYMSAIPLSIMVAVGIERFYNFSVFKNNKFIRMTVMSFFLFIAGSQLMSQKSFANRFQEATAVARYSMQQVLQFKNEKYFLNME